MRVYAYCRVSSDGQATDGTSLVQQEAAVRQYCSTRGLPEPKVYVEVESGSAEAQEKRVEMARLMEAARPSDLILAWSVDRWSRDIVWGVGSVRDLVRRGMGWYSLSEAIDAATPEGDDALGMRALFADMERKRIRERTVGTRQRLRRAGMYTEGQAPYGYARAPKIGNHRADRILHVVPEQAEIVRAIYARALAGESLADITDWLRVNDKKRRWWKTTVRLLLRSRVYLGEMRTEANGGQWIKAHEAIIDSATWAKVQEGLDERKIKPRNTREGARTEKWVLRAFASCAMCGARMSAAYGRGADYYACNKRLNHKCRAGYFRVEIADGIVSGMILERIKELAHLLSTPIEPAAEEPAPDFEGQRKKLQAKRERYQEMFAEGLMTRTELASRLAQLDAERTKIDAEEARYIDRHRVADPERRAKLRTDVESLARTWAKATPPERREALQLLASEVRLQADAEKPVEIAWLSVDELALAEG